LGLSQPPQRGFRLVQTERRLVDDQQARSANCGPCFKFFQPCK
jgi:hypothetical protein